MTTHIWSPPGWPVPPEPFLHQWDAMRAFDLFYDRGFRRFVAELPPGGGKTLLAAFYLRHFLSSWQYALFVTPRLDLVQQTYAAFRRVFPSSELGIIQGSEHNDLGRRITIASLQTLQAGGARLAAYLESLPPGQGATLVIDECHQLGYEHLIEPVLGRPEAGNLLLGLSGTPYRADGVSLARWFPDRIAYSIDPFDLIAQQRLLDVETYTIPFTVDLSQLEIDPNAPLPADLDRRIETEARYHQAFDGWKALSGGTRRTLIFGKSVKDAYGFAEHWSKRGVRCEVITSHTPKGIRDDWYREFQRGEELLCLANYKVLNMGLDLPEAEVIVDGQLSGSAGEVRQIMGRVARPAQGKERGMYIMVEPRDSAQRRAPVPLMTMGDLIGETNQDPKKPLRRALREKLEDELEITLPEDETTPEYALQVNLALKEVRVRSQRTFEEAGWLVDPVTGDAIYDGRSSGQILAERTFTGFQVYHLAPSTGRRTRLTEEAVDARSARGKGMQHLERIKLKIAAKDPGVTIPAALFTEPITAGQLKHLQNKKVYLKTLEGLSQGHYWLCVRHMQAHAGSPYAPGEQGCIGYYGPSAGVRTWTSCYKKRSRSTAHKPQPTHRAQQKAS